MNTDVLTMMFSISLKTRILREWQSANRAQDQDFTERELLTLELISDFGPITEKGLSKIFGISFSGVSELLKRLVAEDFVDGKEKARGKPLVLTPKGRLCLERLKQASATRLGYLFENLSADEWNALRGIFAKADKNAGRWVDQLVFDRYPMGA